MDNICHLILCLFNQEDITDRMSLFVMRDINNEDDNSGIKQKGELYNRFSSLFLHPSKYSNNDVKVRFEEQI